MPLYFYYPFTETETYDSLRRLLSKFGATFPAQNAMLQLATEGAIIRVDGAEARAPVDGHDDLIVHLCEGCTLTFVANLADCANDGDTLYVFGHSADSMKVIADSNKDPIDQSELVARMRAAGLPLDSEARLHVYACMSGSGKNPSDALGEKIAQQLQNEGFTMSANVFGYTAKVNIKPVLVRANEVDPALPVDAWCFTFYDGSGYIALAFMWQGVMVRTAPFAP